MPEKNFSGVVISQNGGMAVFQERMLCDLFFLDRKGCKWEYVKILLMNNNEGIAKVAFQLDNEQMS